MKKKIIMTFLMSIIFLSTSISGAGTQVIQENPLQKQNSDTNDSTLELDSLFDKNNGFINDIAEEGFKLGWVKFESVGKGFHLIIPLKIIKINAPIPTIQYPNFFPFKIDLFITLVVYRDENAITRLTFSDGSSMNITDENHSFLVAMIKIPAMSMLRGLLRNGIYDGIAAFRRFFLFLGRPDILPANIFKSIVKDKFGRLFIDISNRTLNHTLRLLSGVPPRYNGEQMFDFELINRLRDFYFRKNHSIYNITRNFRIKRAMNSAERWNSKKIRTSFYHFYMPQEFIGYSPFIWWKTNGSFSKTVKKVQDLLPDIFYERYNYYWTKEGY